MELGYRFLRVPGGNKHGDADRRIEECDLDGLRVYMCPMTGGDVSYCLNTCKGLRGCRVGQRAAALLDTQARQTAQNGPERGLQMQMELTGKQSAGGATGPGNGPKGATKRTERARAQCREAIATGDPVGYLVQKGLSTKQATTDVSRWRKNYPDLFEGANLPAQRKATSQTEAEREREAMEQYREAELNHQPKPYLWIAETRGIKIVSAMNTLRLWRQKYGPIQQEAEPEPEPEKTDAEEPPEEAPAESDEDWMSLEELLGQYGQGQTEAREKPVPEPEPPREQPAPDPSWVNPNGRLAELMKQEAALLEEIAARQDQIWRIREERRGIERMMSH